MAGTQEETQTMEINRVEEDGKVTRASSFDRAVLLGVPELFKLAEWLVVISAFQYVSERYTFPVAKAAGFILTTAFSAYVGVYLPNLQWRISDHPLANTRRSLVGFLLIVAIGILVIYGSHQMVTAMAAAQAK